VEQFSDGVDIVHLCKESIWNVYTTFVPLRESDPQWLIGCTF
jgi:hypothetical protein